MSDFPSFPVWLWRNYKWAPLLLAGLIGLSCYIEYGTTTTETSCVKKGYPNYHVTWTLERFCIKRVNQTDVVAKLDTLP